MKLRTRLLLALLAVLVLPVAAVTLLSYRSSLAALRETAEAQGRATAAEMTRRMGAVAADVSRRVEGLGRREGAAFPAAAVPGAPAVPADPAEAEAESSAQLLAQLERELGAAATLLDRVELVPPDGDAGGPGAGAAGAPVVVDLGEILKNVKGFVPDVVVDGTNVTYGAPDKLPPEARRAIEQSIRRQAQSAELELARVARQVEAEQRRAETAGQTVPPPELPAPPAHGGHELRFRIRRPSGAEADLRARLSIPRLLGTVVANTRGEAGEIPFAVAADGRLFTPDPRQEPVLRALSVAEKLRPGKSVEVTGGGETWVVVAQRDEASGVMFGLARPIGESLRAMQLSLVRNLGIGLGVIALASGLVFPLSRRMTRPVVQLTEGVRRIAAGDLSARVDVRAGGEIGELGRAVNQMAADLEHQRSQVVEQERIRRELEVCRQIQVEMLPKRPLRVGLSEVKGVSIPAREVGGDFFNYFALDDGSLALLVGDVSGKGVGAALLMANAQAALRALLPLEPSLARLVIDLDREVAANTPSEVFLTLFAAVLEADGRALRWVNAGHNPPFVVRAEGGVERLEATGVPLGMFDGMRHDEQRTPVAPGDLLFFYTDGIVEAFDPQGEQYGTERLEELLATVKRSGVDAVLARVDDAVRTFRAGAEPSDDATMMVLRVG
jgi:serine phosphatase RsbU (regulator of sigma subunit)